MLSVLSSSSLSNEPIDLLGIYSSLPKNTKSDGRENVAWIRGKLFKNGGTGGEKGTQLPPEK